jgi:hypothetical protein
MKEIEKKENDKAVLLHNGALHTQQEFSFCVMGSSYLS